MWRYKAEYLRAKPIQVQYTYTFTYVYYHMKRYSRVPAKDTCMSTIYTCLLLLCEGLRRYDVQKLRTKGLYEQYTYTFTCAYLLCEAVRRYAMQDLRTKHIQVQYTCTFAYT